MEIKEEKVKKLIASLANIILFFSIFSVVSLVFITMTAPTASAQLIIVPDNYTTIQEAIDNANPLGGDTIFVRAGLYEEKLTINKPLTLEGESRTNTTIQPKPAEPGTVITISASWVNVTGFTQSGLLF